MSDRTLTMTPDLARELILSLLAEGVPLLFLPDLAGFATRGARSDFTPDDLCC